MKRYVALSLIFLLSSCSSIHSILNTGAALGLSGVATVGGRYQVQIVECIGNASSQQVVAVFAVTNRGTNVDNIFIGGSPNSTLAIGGYGVTHKPQQANSMTCPQT